MRKLFIKIKSLILSLFKRKEQPVGMSYIDARKETNVLDVDLIDDNASEKDKKEFRQYTKLYVTILSVIACIWVTWSYILATYATVVLQNIEFLMSLSIKVLEVILGVGMGYFTKAFLETATQKAMEIIENHWCTTSVESKVEHKDEEAVG